MSIDDLQYRSRRDRKEREKGQSIFRRKTGKQMFQKQREERLKEKLTANELQVKGKAGRRQWLKSV